MEYMPHVLSKPDSDALADRIGVHFRQHGFGLCAVELRREGSFIGFIGLNVPSFDAPFTPCLEIGWRLAAGCWGQGLAAEGAHAIVRYGFETLGLDELVSFTVPANARSRRVIEKLGMTHDPADDFDHPGLPAGHPLRRHLTVSAESLRVEFGICEQMSLSLLPIPERAGIGLVQFPIS
jgi:RimJ/RimL family protein N-acetyltransferase